MDNVRYPSARYVGYYFEAKGQVKLSLLHNISIPWREGRITIACKPFGWMLYVFEGAPHKPPKSFKLQRLCVRHLSFEDKCLTVEFLPDAVTIYFKLPEGEDSELVKAVHDLIENILKDDSFRSRGRFGPYPEGDVFEAQRVLQEIGEKCRSPYVNRLLQKAKGETVEEDIQEDDEGDENEYDRAHENDAERMARMATGTVTEQLYAVDPIYQSSETFSYDLGESTVDSRGLKGTAITSSESSRARERVSEDQEKITEHAEEELSQRGEEVLTPGNQAGGGQEGCTHTSLPGEQAPALQPQITGTEKRAEQIISETESSIKKRKGSLSGISKTESKSKMRKFEDNGVSVSVSHSNSKGFSAEDTGNLWEKLNQGPHTVCFLDKSEGNSVSNQSGIHVSTCSSSSTDLKISEVNFAIQRASASAIDSTTKPDQSESEKGKREGSQYQCEECTMKFLSRKSMIQHRDAKHGLLSERSERGKKNDAGLKDRSDVGRKKSNTAKDRDVIDKDTSDRQNKKKEKKKMSRKEKGEMQKGGRFCCEVCNVRFGSQKRFDLHMDHFKGTYHEAYFMCCVCCFLAGSRDAMKQHIDSTKHGSGHTVFGIRDENGIFTVQEFYKRFEYRAVNTFYMTDLVPVCKFCHKCFFSVLDCHIHTKEKHNAETYDVGKVIELLRVPYSEGRCSVCRHQFTRMSQNEIVGHISDTNKCLKFKNDATLPGRFVAYCCEIGCDIYSKPGSYYQHFINHRQRNMKRKVKNFNALLVELDSDNGYKYFKNLIKISLIKDH